MKTRNSVNSYIDCTTDHEFLTVSKIHKGRIGGTFSKKEVLKFFPQFEKFKSTSTIYQKFYGYWREVNLVWKKAKDIDEKIDFGVKRLDLTIKNQEVFNWTNEFNSTFGIEISNSIKINEEFCELIGIWLAEGSSNGSQLSFTINKAEENFKKRIIYLMWNIFKLDNFSIYERKDSQAVTISYSSRQLLSFFEQLFKVDNLKKVNQWNKYIPDILKFIEPKIQLQIFKGWFIGDGYARISAGKEAKGTTVSKRLAEDMIFILNRNFINPFVQKESRINNSTAYNIMFYAEKAEKLYKMKYESDYADVFLFSLQERNGMDIPFIYNKEYYLKTKIEFINEELEDNHIMQEVYCLQVPSQNFTINDTIVHNCRGYRSPDFPDGIDVDEAQYMSSMIKVERGVQWSLEDCFYGNKDKKREPIKELIEEVEKYSGLKEIIFSINGLISRRGQHASGVYIFNKEGFMNYNALMRSPNGSLTTQFDMEDSDYQGCLKYDNLSTEATDKIRKTLDLLLEYGYIEDKGSLKETYNFYLHPDKLDYSTKEMWQELSNNEIIDAFQMNTAVGQDALKKIKPTNLVELAHVSSLMRLMGEKGKINPIDKYVAYKNDVSLWYKEMDKYKLSKEEQSIFEKYLLKYFGVAATQEDVMRICMNEDLCGLSLKEANKVRKAIAKKKASMVEEIKEMVKSKCRNGNIFNYIWSEVISPQLGYSFSINHTTPYAIVCIQEMNLYHKFPHVFWNCACLTTSAAKAVQEDEAEIREMIREGYEEIEFVEEDDDDEEDNKKKKASSSNYDKIAVAIGEIKSKGIIVSLPDINKSMLEFTPDVSSNRILYGLKGLTNVSDELINVIVENRPYTSFKDFEKKVKVTKTVAINLIKAGCFDAIDKDRISLMKDYITEISKPKTTLNLRNFQSLMRYNLLPASLDDCKYAFIMGKALKERKKDDEYYVITEDLFPYFEGKYGSDYIEIIDNKSCIGQKVWDKCIYKPVMEDAKAYIKSNLTELLEKFNKILFDELWEKYCLGSLSKWEMDSASFYFSDHELKNIDYNYYGISHFNELEAEPQPIRFYKYYPIYDICQIAGTVLGKNKIKSTITILDADGSVVTVKFRKEYFNIYDKQISERQEDGTKKVIEKSWFKRGNKLVIAGYRRDKDFIPKTYSSTPFKTLYNITNIDDNNRLSLRESRIGDE